MNYRKRQYWARYTHLGKYSRKSTKRLTREIALSMSVCKCGSSPHGPVARRPSQALWHPSLGPSYESPVLL
jgi:hypothetical protein